MTGKQAETKQQKDELNIKDAFGGFGPNITALLKTAMEKSKDDLSLKWGSKKPKQNSTDPIKSNETMGKNVSTPVTQQELDKPKADLNVTNIFKDFLKTNETRTNLTSTLSPEGLNPGLDLKELLKQSEQRLIDVKKQSEHMRQLFGTDTTPTAPLSSEGLQKLPETKQQNPDKPHKI